MSYRIIYALTTTTLINPTNTMKITNYNRGYQTWCDCVIHGTIYVSTTEAKRILRNNKDNPYTSFRPYHFALGVTATYKIASKLPKYKDSNYQFKII